MKYECNNVRACHNMKVLVEERNAVRVICKECKNQYVIHNDWRGAPEKRLYAKLFKRDILQGNDNLFYKYHPEYLKK